MDGQDLPCQFLEIEKDGPKFGKKTMVVFIYAWNSSVQETEEQIRKPFVQEKMEKFNFCGYKIFVSFKHQWLENHKCKVYQTVRY